ncbi:MAG: PAC2 family protein [Candidatus Brockarchaeota archaeon]|nr:PAC2 family protein [Candidatus Brockarchaeota archaeon]
MALFERIEPGADAKGSTAVFGMYGWGSVGKICLNLLIDLLRPDKIGECSTPALSDFLISQGDGFGRLPTIEYYLSKRHEPRILAITGDAVVNQLDARQFYGTIEHVVSTAKRLGAARLIAVDGAIGSERDGIKVFASRPSLARRAAVQGATILEKSVVQGYAGVAVGLARLLGLDGVGVVVPCENPEPNQRAGLSAFKYLVSFLDLRLQPG